MTTTIDFGADLNMLPDGDLDPNGTEITGTEVVKQRLFRRFTTENGGVFYDLSFGESLVALLSDASTPSGRQALQQRIVKQAILDESVESAKAVIDFDSTTQSAVITITLVGADGPFDMVLSVDKVTVAVLNQQQA